MPVRGGRAVRRNMRRLVHEIADDLTPTVVKEILIIGEGYAAALTPVDTSNLINSGFRTVTNTATGAVGVVGYTADYAAAVHGMSGKLKGQPREDFGMTSNRSDFGPTVPRSFGGGTGKGTYWSPNAEPGWLTKGFERDGKAEIEAHIRRRYKK